MRKFNKFFLDSSIFLEHRLSKLYEKYLGIDTWKTVRLDKSTFYEPTSYSLLRKTFKSIEIKESDSFIDFGSGKGRVLMMAARYPFKRVIGIDNSTRLNEIARQNIKKLEKKLKCKNLSIVTADASSYDLPSDITIAYLYNSFSLDILHNVLCKIKKSLDDKPREFTFIYNNPVFYKELEEYTWLKKVFVYELELNKISYLAYNIYKVVNKNP